MSGNPWELKQLYVGFEGWWGLQQADHKSSKTNHGHERHWPGPGGGNSCLGGCGGGDETTGKEVAGSWG